MNKKETSVISQWENRFHISSITQHLWGDIYNNYKVKEGRNAFIISGSFH